MSKATTCTRRLWYLPVLLLGLVCALAMPARLSAQNDPVLDENASGTLFMVAFPDTTSNALDSRYPNTRVRSEASLWIFSAVKNKVKIISNGGASTTLTLDAGKFKIYQIPGSIVVDVSGSPIAKSLKIEADYPIVMYCYFANIQGVEAWTPIPVELWGTQYSAACVPGEVVKEIGISGETEVPETPKPGNAEILVIAAYDNTTVTLTPPPGTNFDQGAPRTVTLNEGQVYQVQSIVDASDDAENQQDLGATSIVSDKPIGVISGNTRVQIVVDEVGLKNNAYKNMLIEWIAPTEQHGKKFVYMGTWDSHRPGIGAAAERKREFVRLYNTVGKTAPTKGHYLQPGGVTQVPFSIKRDTLHEVSLGAPTATYFETEEPSQAFMHSSAIVQFNGSTPCFRGIPCLSYSAWAPYMVELAPREQWPTFAPYYAPPNPGGMQHYINVVTDTNSVLKIKRENGSTFLFNRKIPGTDLIWGSMSVSQGEDHWLQGKDGARFWGFAYGIYQGGEEYRPGRTKKKDDAPSTASGGGKESPAPLHPCEYEEYNAVSYGYPLSPTRRVLKPADSLQIDTTMDCWTLTIKIRAINASPVGLRSVTLDPTSVKNAKLTPIDPQRLSDIIGRSRIELKVEPINPLQDAEATVIIKDRTGKMWQVYYKYEAEYVTMTPTPELRYGQVTLGSTVSRTVTITNPLKRPLEVKEIRLAIGTQGYVITSTTPDGPANQPNPKPVTLQPGETITVDIAVTPVLENQDYVDTLKVVLGCTKVPLPLITQTVKPIIYVSDLDFGTFVLGQDGPKTKDLEVCNIGGGQLRFTKPGDPDPTHLLEWLAAMGYTVDPADIAKLKDTVLGKNQCFTLKVTFTPTVVGSYKVTARYWATTREQRDTSVWTAEVVKPGPVLTPYDWEEQWLTAKAGINCTKNGVPMYEALIYVLNAGSSDVQVESLTMIDQDATDGFFVFDTTDRFTRVMKGDNVRPGDSLRQKVQFIPTTERPYQTRVRLITQGGDTVYSILKGTGIESHGSITGIKYDTAVYNNPYPGTPSQRKLVYVTAKPTRPLTITGIEAQGVDAGNFWVDPADLARLPVTLNPGETDSFYVEFRAQASGDRTAKIVFKGDHSLCDDSTNVLSVYTFTRGVVTRGVDFGNVLTCDTRDSVVVMTNTGTEPVTVVNVTLDDKTNFFSMQIGSVPFDLAPGETRSFAVHFEPGKVGTFTATVNFEVVGTDGLPVAAAPVQLQGKGYILTVTAHIDRNHRGHPGATVVTPVLLDQALDQARITKFFIGVLYNNKMMRLVNGSPDPEDLAEMLKGTIVEGWTLSIVESDHPEGEYLAVVTSPDKNTFLTGTGALLNPKFQLYLGSVDSAKLNFYMLLVGKQCARVIPTPGLARIDSVCGLNLRLIESTGFGYALDQNKPNPFNPSTDITFSLGLDGQTSLVVYDALGRKVATLVDGYMQPGTYQVTWDASTHPSGLYYYRLQSGVWTRSSTMILRK